MKYTKFLVNNIVSLVDGISTILTGKRIIGYNDPDPYENNPGFSYHTDPIIDRLYRELIADGLSEVQREIHIQCEGFISEIENRQELINLDFMDFYDSLNDDLKTSIQFSLVLKKLSEYNFRYYKESQIHRLNTRISYS